MLANGNPGLSNESSSEESPVDNVPDLNQSVGLSERGQALSETQDETSCRSCSMVFQTDLNQSAELSERGELCQTEEKVRLPGNLDLKIYSVSQRDFEFVTCFDADHHRLQTSCE